MSPPSKQEHDSQDEDTSHRPEEYPDWDHVEVELVLTGNSVHIGLEVLGTMTDDDDRVVRVCVDAEFVGYGVGVRCIAGGRTG